MTNVQRIWNDVNMRTKGKSRSLIANAQLMIGVFRNTRFVSYVRASDVAIKFVLCVENIWLDWNCIVEADQCQRLGSRG